MNNLVNIKFHGALGKTLGKEYKLAVGSVQEALRSVDIVSGRKLTKYFMRDGNFNREYQILVNGREVASQHPRIDTPEKVMESELAISRGTISTIDVIPAVSGADGDFLSIILVVVAVLLIATGIGAGFVGGGAFSLGGTIGGISSGAYLVAGLALLVGGISNLLTKPPEFDEWKDNSKSGRRSYSFNGPTNTAGEGGAVPFGYGRLLVGSQTIDTTYEITYRESDEHEFTT